MATGIPRTKWNGQQAIAPSRNSTSDTIGMTLTYEGKQPEQTIFATPPVPLLPLWGDINNTSNQLYYGDNLPILAHLLTNPMICGQVRLIYIDPPFATKSVFQSRSQKDAYKDLLVGSQYIEFLRSRLILLRELLAPDGSIYIHLDDNMAFHIKIIMDEIFGQQNFRNWITRKKCNPKNYTRKTYGNISDYLLFYTKTESYVWNRPTEPWSEEHSPKEYRYREESTGRQYMKVPLHAPGVRGGETGKPWRGMMPPPGKHWQFPPATLDLMDARGEIYWSPSGNPRRKIYLDESDGIPVQDIWLDIKDAHNQNIHITGYPTEKNPDLLKRIIAASSNYGDLVLDCFAGSGTTLGAAEELERHWIGIDNSPESIETTLNRLVKGLEPMGDFVTQRTEESIVQENKIASPVAARLEPVPLFPSDIEATPHGSFIKEESLLFNNSAHVPEQQIPSFSIFAAEPYSGELDVIIKDMLT